MDLSGFLPGVLAGTLLGSLTGLGIGGGSLLVLWLTLAVRLEYSVARGISLLFFFPAALLSCISCRGQLPFRQVLPGVISGCLAAGIFSRLSGLTDPGLFRRYLGAAAMAAGLSELLKKKRKIIFSIGSGQKDKKRVNYG